MKSVRNRFPVTLYLDKKLAASVSRLAKDRYDLSLSKLTEALWKREAKLKKGLL